jgi:hypothetical protein
MCQQCPVEIFFIYSDWPKVIIVNFKSLTCKKIYKNQIEKSKYEYAFTNYTFVCLYWKTIPWSHILICFIIYQESIFYTLLLKIST